MTMNARGTTVDVGDVVTLMGRILLTISPRLNSLVVSSLRLSSCVTPLMFWRRTIRLPSASLSRYVFSSTSDIAVVQAVEKCRAISSILSLSPVSPSMYRTMERLFMRSPIAIVFPFTAISIGAVAVRVVATFWNTLYSRE